jgi:hypothetical protein
MPGPLENLRDEFLMVLVDRLEYDTRQPLITCYFFPSSLPNTWMLEREGRGLHVGEYLGS